MELDLIYTKDDMIISKQHLDWRVWQERFEDYKASLSFIDLEELTEFLVSEYNLTGVNTAQIESALNNSNSDLLVLELPEDNDGIISFREHN